MSLGGTGEMVDGVPAFVPGFGSDKAMALSAIETAADRDRPGLLKMVMGQTNSAFRAAKRKPCLAMPLWPAW